jgi:hypothetical protein
MALSSCCAAEIIDTDICFDCREHCDPISEEDDREGTDK